MTEGASLIKNTVSYTRKKYVLIVSQSGILSRIVRFRDSCDTYDTKMLPLSILLTAIHLFCLIYSNTQAHRLYKNTGSLKKYKSDILFVTENKPYCNTKLLNTLRFVNKSRSGSTLKCGVKFRSFVIAAGSIQIQAKVHYLGQ